MELGPAQSGPAQPAPAQPALLGGREFEHAHLELEWLAQRG